MGSCTPVGRAAAMVPLLLGALLLGKAPGHDIRMSAHVEGHQIVGKVYVRGGAPVAGATVTALDPNNHQLASAQTDQQGLFRLTVQRRCDHRLLADAGDGHGAQYLIQASLLPEDLPAADDSPSIATPRVQQPSAAEDATAGPSADTRLQTPPGAENHPALRQLRAEIADLRQQLEQYQQRVRLLDILGGVGYILGLTGIAHYWLSLRRHR